MVPSRLSACEISPNIPGRKAALNEPRLIRIAVDAKNVEAMTWLRSVCTIRMSCLSLMTPFTHICRA